MNISGIILMTITPGAILWPMLFSVLGILFFHQIILRVGKDFDKTEKVFERKTYQLGVFRFLFLFYKQKIGCPKEQDDAGSMPMFRGDLFFIKEKCPVNSKIIGKFSFWVQVIGFLLLVPAITFLFLFYIVDEALITYAIIFGSVYVLYSLIMLALSIVSLAKRDKEVEKRLNPTHTSSKKHSFNLEASVDIMPTTQEFNVEKKEQESQKKSNISDEPKEKPVAKRNMWG